MKIEIAEQLCAPVTYSKNKITVRADIYEPIPETKRDEFYKLLDECFKYYYNIVSDQRARGIKPSAAKIKEEVYNTYIRPFLVPYMDTPPSPVEKRVYRANPSAIKVNPLIKVVETAPELQKRKVLSEEKADFTLEELKARFDHLPEEFFDAIENVEDTEEEVVDFQPTVVQDTAFGIDDIFSSVDNLKNCADVDNPFDGLFDF